MSYFYLIFSGICIGITSLFLYLHRRYTYWSRFGIKGPSLFDGLKSLGIPVDEVLKSRREKYGSIYGTYDFFGRNLVITDPEQVKEVLIKEFHKFPEHIKVYFGEKATLNLFALPGDEQWKRVRSVITPAFSSGKLKAMMGSLDELSDKFIQTLNKVVEKDELIDMKSVVGAFVMDALTSCAFGIQTDSLNHPEHPCVVHAKKAVFINFNFGMLICVLFPKIAEMMGFSVIDKSSIRFFASLTKRLYDERKGQTSNSKRKDFLQLMIDAEDEMENMKTDGSSTNKSITMDELVAQAILFFIAGYDTTGTSISHAIYYLAKYPECQEKLRQELETLDKVDIDSLTELKYLEAVIQETLRIAPPLTRIERHCVEDHILGDTGIIIKAGMLVSVDAYSLQRDPNYFEDPNTFNPERFIDSPNLTLLTFGGGPRLCVGMRFALKEMRICLAKLIKNFRFRFSEETKLEYFPGILLAPKEVKLRVEKRT